MRSSRSKRRQSQHLARVPQHRGARFDRVAARPVARQEGVAQVGVGQGVALEQPAHADRFAAVAQRHPQQAMAVARVAVDRTVEDVAHRAVEIAHAAVADVVEEGRFVEQLQDEAGIVGREFAQLQAFGLDRGHGTDRSVGGTVNDTTARAQRDRSG